MKPTFQQIEHEINRHLSSIENSLSLADITIRHGLNSFRYGTSEFLRGLFTPLNLAKNTVFYDLGSGYGRVILYGAINQPDVYFKGIEILEERARVCSRIIEKTSLKNACSICGDFLNLDISDGDIFYIFNPLHEFQYSALLTKIKEVSLTKEITVIAESKCDVFDQMDWLHPFHHHNLDIIRKITYYHSSPLSK